MTTGLYWRYKLYKAPVKSSPTDQHPVFLQVDALPVTQPTVSIKALKGIRSVLHYCIFFSEGAYRFAHVVFLGLALDANVLPTPVYMTAPLRQPWTLTHPYCHDYVLRRGQQTRCVTQRLSCGLMESV